jgi:hypothetical protein
MPIADEIYFAYINAALSFDAPEFKSMEDHLVWKIDPQNEPLRQSDPYGHIYDWPAPVDERSRHVTNNYVITIMFTKAVGGTPRQQAMTWAEEEIKRIYTS